MNNGKDVPPGTERSRLGRIGRLARAARAGLRKWSDWLAGFPAAARMWGEPLEARQLLSAFNITLAAPASATLGVQFYVYVWTAGGTMTGSYTVDPGDSSGTFPYAYSTTSRVTAIPITYSTSDPTGTPFTIRVSASTSSATATQTYGMMDVGNYPAEYAGPTTYLPPSATTATANSVVVDPGTHTTYVAESYYNSSTGHQMALTRLTSADIPDTGFGVASGSAYTGTYLVSAFGGGTGSSSSDVVYAAAVLDSGTIDEIALAGHSTNGFAVAIINVSGAGSTVATSDYTGSQTMPAGTAYAVTFDSSNDVVAAGTNGTQTAMVAVALYGTGSDAGELDTNFGTSGVTDIDTADVALAIMQEPDTSGGGNSDVVLGGWTGSGCGTCCTFACCSLTLVGLQDALGGGTRGDLDTSGFGSEGVASQNVGVAAESAGFNGCSGAGASYDSVYSLAWDDELGEDGEIIAIGGTNYSGSNQFALWALSLSGTSVLSFGVADGLAVPNVNATAAGGAIDVDDSSTNDGKIYMVGTIGVSSYDLFLGRATIAGTPTTTPSGQLDTSYGTVPAGVTSGQGYFTQDLGAATTNSNDIGRAMAVQSDGTALIVGNTTSNYVAVARYFDGNGIAVSAMGDGVVFRSMAAVQAASQPGASFSAGPTITSDVAENDLSPLDGTYDMTTLRRRSSAGRAVVRLSASPPSSAPAASSPSA